jgi:PAS domain S-box-containing protein
MEVNRIDFDEEQRRGLQEYIFDLEELKEKAEELTTAHEKLKSSQDLLVTVLGCTVHGLALMKNGIFVWCNRALMEIFGWDQDELIGRTFEILCPDRQEYESICDTVDNMLSMGGLMAYEYELAHKDGRHVPCFVTGRALDQSDLSKGCVFSITDFTERNRSQEALKRAYDELEQRSAELVHTNERLNREIEERRRAEANLNKYREQLEELVMARTLQLTTVNAQLRQEVEERGRAEEELKKANDYLESILKDSPDAIAIVDKHGKFVRWSKMTAGLYGSSFDEFTGRYAYEFYADPAERDRMLTQLRRDGFVNKYEVTMKKKDGGTFPAEISISLLKDNRNSTIGSVAITRDLSDIRKVLDALRTTNEQLNSEIAARQQVEISLRKSENEYRAIFENTGTATVILENDATISLANAEYEKLSGFSRQEIEGRKKWTEFVVEEDLERMKEYHRVRRIEQDSVPRQYEFRFRNKSGRLGQVFATVAMIPGSSRSVASLLDITDQKRMEAEALKAQKLESLGILAGGIAHDFNNILTAILGNISLAKLFVKPEDKILKRLEETEKASLRAKDLTQQLLTFSKGGDPVKKTMSIAELIEETAIFALRGSNVNLEFSLPEDLWPVEIDEGQINQVINNLIINADQAMPAGGTVEIAAENVVLEPSSSSPLQSGRFVRVTIQDQGIGIRKDHLSKIFDPYFTTKEHGTGLGLATAYSIIRRHGGQVRAESAAGVGTKFYFQLPASTKEIPSAVEFAGKPVAGRGRVLAMDDEAIIQEVLAEMLDYLGYEVSFAWDGAEAIEIYKASKLLNKCFDVVIMDLTVPGGMGGKEAVKQLLEIHPDVKAIVSSGYSNDPVMADFKEYGFVGVLSKPYRIDQIAELLHRLVPAVHNSTHATG